MLSNQSLQEVDSMSSPWLAWPSLVTMLILCGTVLAQSKESAMAQHISYRTVNVDGLSIFYREAGPKGAPTILLLHGLPSSSRMFEPLLTRLAGQFHMVAPDYPGFGHSDAPTLKQFQGRHSDQRSRREGRQSLTRSDVPQLSSAGGQVRFVCENGHGCALISFDDQKIAELQRADFRCARK